MMGYGMGMVGLGVVVMIGFWVLVIGGAVWLAVTLARGNQSSVASNQPYALTTLSSLQPDPTPLDILKARYARGELTQEQFEAMRRDLGV